MTAPADRWIVAFDIGGHTTKVAAVSERGAIQHWRAFPTEANSQMSYLSALVTQIRSVQAAAGFPAHGVAGAVAGFVNESGEMFYNPNLAWLEGVRIAEVLEAELGLPVHLENDANAACAGEYVFGSGQQSNRFLCLTGGTGLGVGMICAGRLLRPAFNGLGDAGHVIVMPDGPKCSCGGHGCAEVLLSTMTLKDQYAAATQRPQTFRDLVEAARTQSPAALGVVEQAGRWLGIALASLTNIFAPDRIAIAGGLSVCGEPLLRSATASLAAHAGKYPASLVSLTLASTGAHAPVMGAAACFFLSDASDAFTSDRPV